jgi:ribonuclease VapC
LILDTSAVIALIGEEQGSDDLIEKMNEAGRVAIGAPTLVEATVVLVRRFGVSGRVSLDRFVEERDVSSIPLPRLGWRFPSG